MDNEHPASIEVQEHHTEVVITREHLDGVEFYRGKVIHDQVGTLYETTRMSEQAIKQALTRYLWQVKLSLHEV